MNPAQHCTHTPHRVSPPSAWPLRNAAGQTWAEAKAAKPACKNCHHWRASLSYDLPHCNAGGWHLATNVATGPDHKCHKFLSKDRSL